MLLSPGMCWFATPPAILKPRPTRHTHITHIHRACIHIHHTYTSQTHTYITHPPHTHIHHTHTHNHGVMSNFLSGLSPQPLPPTLGNSSVGALKNRTERERKKEINKRAQHCET